MIRRSICTLALVAASASLARAEERGVAARVNGVPIEAERLQRYFEDTLAEKGRSAAAIRSPSAYRALHREALERLIDTELLWQEAQRRKISATPAEVDAALAEVRAQFRAPGAFERRLARGGFTEESYARYLHQQLSIRRLVQEEVVSRVAPAEAGEALSRKLRELRARGRVEIAGER